MEFQSASENENYLLYNTSEELPSIVIMRIIITIDNENDYHSIKTKKNRQIFGFLINYP